MLLTIFIILLVLAIIFLLITLEWNSLFTGSMTIILWIILALTVHQIEIPYTAIQNDNTIISGVQTIETLYPLSYLFWAFALVMFIYLITDVVRPMFQEKTRNKGMT